MRFSGRVWLRVRPSGNLFGIKERLLLFGRWIDVAPSLGRPQVGVVEEHGALEVV